MPPTLNPRRNISLHPLHADQLSVPENSGIVRLDGGTQGAIVLRRISLGKFEFKVRPFRVRLFRV